MDNQQELAYLAGIVDGEGSIGLFSFKRSHGPTMHSRVTIVNTNEAMINWLAAFYSKNEIPFYLHWRAPRSKRHRPTGFIQVNRHSGVKKLLELIRPFLVAKTRQADLLLEYVNGRILPSGATRYRGQDHGYAPRDFEIERELKALNGVSFLNDYMSGSAGEDIVCTAAKVADLTQ